MKRFLERVLHGTDSRGFWIGVFITAVLFVFAYAWVGNRHVLRDHEVLIAKQQQQLTYLCQTISVLDVFTQQQIRIARETLQDPELPLWAQIYLAKRERVLGQQRGELSNVRGCRQIE